MSRDHGANRRGGFTLVELLLVLALVVVLADLSWPAVRGPLARFRLRQSAAQLTGVLADARRDAIATERTYELRFQVEGGRLRWGPSAALSGDGEDDVNAVDEPVEERRFELPPGVRFGEGATSTPLEAELDDATAEAFSWSDAVLFFPDGRTSDAAIELIGTRGDAVAVHLRGLTGATRVGAIERRDPDETWEAGTSDADASTVVR